jgi:hypothetical protein
MGWALRLHSDGNFEDFQKAVRVVPTTMTSVKISTSQSKGQTKKRIILHFRCNDNNKYTHFKKHHEEFTMEEELLRELHAIHMT